MYYDIRIKAHNGLRDKCVVFIFTDVSAEKELQREQVMKKYTRIMLNSMHHELRTPIHGIQSSLELIKPYVSSHANRQYNICRCALQFLLSLVNDTLDYA